MTLTEERLERELNASQIRAVKHTAGPLLILAGAGSGKTRVLAYRAAYLVQSQAAQPRQILALTFTNKAAGELRSRITAMVGSGGEAVAAGTFHSLFARFLRREGLNVGIDPNFTIIDAEDKRKLLKTIIDELRLDAAQYKPALLDWIISAEKNSLQSPDDVERRAHYPNQEIIAGVYRRYEKRLSQMNGLDFDDLLVKPVEAFRRHPDFLRRLQEQFIFIMVDEFQDTNYVQGQLVTQLAAFGRNLCVVGDDDQAIYGWRGATVRNILEFKKDWPDAKVVHLEQNYRSTAPILEAAWSVIRNNRFRHPKKLWTDRREGEKLIIHAARDDDDEAQRFVSFIQDEHRAHGTPYRDCAILYRINAQSLPFERTLREMSIPYRVVGGLRFYDRKEVKDVIAYLRLIINPADDVSLIRIINYPPRGISQTLQNDIQARARADGTTIWRAALKTAQDEDTPIRQKNALNSFISLIEEFRAEFGTKPLREFIEDIVSRIELINRLKEEQKVDPSLADLKVANIQSLFTEIERFSAKNPDGRLDEFLEQVALVTDADRYEDSSDGVNLMTLHSAKGLEYHTVCIGGLEEGLLPLSPPDGSSPDVEEERRLLYVGITRAGRRLALGFARNRLQWGQFKWNNPSRFLSELPADYFTRPNKQTPKSASKAGSTTTTVRRRAFSVESQSASANVDPDQLRKGLLVRHPKFGLGVVVNYSKKGADSTAQVDFDEYGLKTLLLRLARLEVSA